MKGHTGALLFHFFKKTSPFCYMMNNFDYDEGEGDMIDALEEKDNYDFEARVLAGKRLNMFKTTAKKIKESGYGEDSRGRKNTLHCLVWGMLDSMWDVNTPIEHRPAYVQHQDISKFCVDTILSLLVEQSAYVEGVHRFPQGVAAERIDWRFIERASKDAAPHIVPKLMVPRFHTIHWLREFKNNTDPTLSDLASNIISDRESFDPSLTPRQRLDALRIAGAGAEIMDTGTFQVLSQQIKIHFEPYLDDPALNDKAERLWKALNQIQRSLQAEWIVKTTDRLATTMSENPELYEFRAESSGITDVGSQSSRSA